MLSKFCPNHMFLGMLLTILFFWTVIGVCIVLALGWYPQ